MDNFDKYSNHQKELSYFIDYCCPINKDSLKLELQYLSLKMCEGEIPGDGFFAAQMWLRNESLRDITLPSEGMLESSRRLKERYLDQLNSDNNDRSLVLSISLKPLTCSFSNSCSAVF